MHTNKTEEINTEDIQTVFDKLISFRKTILDKNQEAIAEEIRLNQNKISRLEKQQGQLPYLVAILLHYHNQYRLDLNSVFNPSAPVQQLPAKDDSLFDIVEG